MVRTLLSLQRAKAPSLVGELRSYIPRTAAKKKKRKKKKTICNKPNVSPSNSFVETLSPSVLVFGDGAFGR